MNTDVIQTSIDISGALRKTATLRTLPIVAEQQASVWAAETVKELKLAADALKKSGRKTSHLKRNIAMKVESHGDNWSIRIGTGVWAGANSAVKYADIQDKGGTIHAKDKMLTIPFPGVKGTAANFRDKQSFIMKSSRGNLIIAQRVGKRGTLKPLFLLKREVKIPATGWFTNTLNRRMPELNSMMQPGVLYRIAEGMV